MIGQESAQAILRKALGYARSDQAEGLLLGTSSNLTRFANNAIHQNVAEENASLNVRVVFGKRIGQASTNDLSDSAIKHAVDVATEIARLQAENPEFVSLPSPLPVRPVRSFADRTLNCSPEERAKAVAVICARAKGAGLIAAGAYSTDCDEIAVANSLGINAYHAQTVAEISTVVMSDDSSGYGYRVHRDVEEIDVDAVAEEAVGKALRGRRPRAAAAGHYEVILEPYAVQDILAFLGYLSLNALAVKEKRSFVEGRFGQPVLGRNVSIFDDGLDPCGIPMPFDYEGVPKQHVDFFKDGVAAGVVYDSFLAFQEGKQSTGHSVPSPLLNGPVPLNMSMKTGEAAKDEIVQGVKRGLWVTRFWYTRPIEPLQVSMTGMTRDGTFLIENGEVVGPVRNLRFTQSYVDALKNVRAISREAQLVRENGAVFNVPTIDVGDWNFVSATEY